MIHKIKKSFAATEACHHGGKIRAMASRLGVDQGDLLDFSANINPLGSPPLEDLIQQEMKSICHYPDNEYSEFRRAAADFVGVDPENIVPGNGSSELFRLFAEMIIEDGDKTVITIPTFGEYETQSRLFGAQIKYVHRGVQVSKNPEDFLDDRAIKESKAVFICNPNNPTGTLLARSQIADLARRCERYETFLLVDEAFIELSDPSQSVAEMAPLMDYLFVSRSLTKSFGVPGFRLGFGVAGNCMAKVMNRTRLPWSISSLASAVGAYLLGQVDHLEKSREKIKSELTWLTEKLRLLDLNPVESTVNFILVNVRSTGYTSTELTEKMIFEKVLVRDCRSFPGLGDGYIRVAVRSRDENEQLVNALETVLRCAE
ncbi:MAG: threonine-phosphate decarboxylase CobD [Methanotrichaceae archaeon]